MTKKEIHLKALEKPYVSLSRLAEDCCTTHQDALEALLYFKWTLHGSDTLYPPYHPYKPTRGWCMSELERLGHTVRGTPVSDSAMITLLQSYGYDVSLGSKAKAGDR